ncbi:MAG TPA: SRPBCC domain-containing protein [Cytophagales bacterium]|nr:SRPBCC domain-containing protein [Cytophagales bacterium]
MESITVEIVVNAAPENVWKAWTTPENVIQWNSPSSDWHSPVVEIDLREQGEFLFRMGAKDGREGFDHAGIYDKIIPHQFIEYTTREGRKSKIVFTSTGKGTKVSETFEPDRSVPLDMQRDFVQAVLENFKNHVEGR